MDKLFDPDSPTHDEVIDKKSSINDEDVDDDDDDGDDDNDVYVDGYLIGYAKLKSFKSFSKKNDENKMENQQQQKDEKLLDQNNSIAESSFDIEQLLDKFDNDMKKCIEQTDDPDDSSFVQSSDHEDYQQENHVENLSIVECDTKQQRNDTNNDDIIVDIDDIDITLMNDFNIAKHLNLKSKIQSTSTPKISRLRKHLSLNSKSELMKSKLVNENDSNIVKLLLPKSSSNIYRNTIVNNKKQTKTDDYQLLTLEQIIKIIDKNLN